MESNEEMKTPIKKICTACVNCGYDCLCGYNALHCSIHGSLETPSVGNLDEKAENCPDFKAGPNMVAKNEPIVAVEAPKLTYDTIQMPTYEEALEKTFPDYDNFDCLYGKMGASDDLARFTKTISYKVKLDPPENGRDYRIKQMPVYPKFLELFEGKESVGDITLFDVNMKFSKEQFQEALKEDEERNALANASVEIMENMKAENRFAFDAPLKDSDYTILKKYIKDTDRFKNYSALLSDSFVEMLPDFAKMGEESGNPVDFNPTFAMFMSEPEEGEEGDDFDTAEDDASDCGFMPTSGAFESDWTVEKG